MLVSVTPLGAHPGRDVGAAVAATVEYLDSRKRQVERDLGLEVANGSAGRGTEDGAVGYYADSSDQPGRWAGRGVAGVQLRGAVGRDQLARMLLGQDPRSGAQLITRLGAPVVQSPDLDGTAEMIPLGEAAGRARIGVGYVRRVARASEAAMVRRTVELMAGAPLTRPPKRWLAAERSGPRGGWQVSPAELVRFNGTRSTRTTVIAYDVTFSAPKSVSILWACSPPKVRAEILRAVDGAVAAGVAYLETNAAFVRQRGQRLPADGLLAASYLHTTSRALDPQLHRHVVVGSFAAATEESPRTLYSTPLFAHAKTAGCIAAAELRHQLTQRHAAGAMGPMQFLAATWSAYGVDGDHDGRVDVYDSIDAIWSAARYLCANGAGNAGTLRSAIWVYNHSESYVDQVLHIAASYASEPTSQTGHALPLDRSVFEEHPDYLTAPHHDYPAIDIPVPVGTAVYAAAGGTVELSSPGVGSCGGTIIIDATDGARYTYCHLSAEFVASGGRLDTGAQIALSGGQPGAPGAGDATGPHLHLGIAVNGTNVCPQVLLTAWFKGTPTDPAAAPTSGCSY